MMLTRAGVSHRHASGRDGGIAGGAVVHKILHLFIKKLLLVSVAAVTRADLKDGQPVFLGGLQHGHERLHSAAHALNFIPFDLN